MFSCFFFFNDTATTEIYTLSLHDALPIYSRAGFRMQDMSLFAIFVMWETTLAVAAGAASIPIIIHLLNRKRFRIVTWRSEEHTSELQSRPHLICRLLLEKKI